MNTCTADASASEPEATASTSRGSSENKAELMESAHLLCSLFDNKPKNDNLTTALKASSTSTSTSTTSTSISAISSETKTNARKKAKGPLKKRRHRPLPLHRPASFEEAARVEVETTTSASSEPSKGTVKPPPGGFSVSLYTEGTDEEHLSPQLCLTRQQIEVFAATQQDICSRRSAGGRSITKALTVGQVGIRCRHCKHLPLRGRAMSAVHYPGSIRLIYQAVRNFQRNHFQQCTAIPQDTKDKFASIRSRFVQSKGRSHLYWESDGSQKGLIDTDAGIRFSFLRIDPSEEVDTGVDDVVSSSKKSRSTDVKMSKKKSKKCPKKKAKKTKHSLDASEHGVVPISAPKPPALAAQVTLDDLDLVKMSKQAEFKSLREEVLSSSSSSLLPQILHQGSSVVADVPQPHRAAAASYGATAMSSAAALPPTSMAPSVESLGAEHASALSQADFAISRVNSLVDPAVSSRRALLASPTTRVPLSSPRLRALSDSAALAGLALPPTAETAALAGHSLSPAVLQAARTQAAAATGVAPVDGLAEMNSACATEYLIYLQTLESMSTAINSAQLMAQVYAANPSATAQVMCAQSNAEMMELIHLAKMQAMNLKQLRLKSQMQELDASIAAKARAAVVAQADFEAAVDAGMSDANTISAPSAPLLGASAAAAAPGLSPSSSVPVRSVFKDASRDLC